MSGATRRREPGIRLTEVSRWQLKRHEPVIVTGSTPAWSVHAADTTRKEIRPMTHAKLSVSIISTIALLSSGALAQSLGGAKVEVREQQPYGKFLTDANGRALYMFTADKPGNSNCYDQCAELWPPIITSEKPRKGEMVNEQMIDMMKRRDGKWQVTYNSMPLYYYAKDQGPGATTGQDVKDSGGEWYLVSPHGKPIKAEGKS